MEEALLAEATAVAAAAASAPSIHALLQGVVADVAAAAAATALPGNQAAGGDAQANVVSMCR